MSEQDAYTPLDMFRNVIPKTPEQIAADRIQSVRETLRVNPLYTDNPELLEAAVSEFIARTPVVETPLPESVPEITWQHPDFPLDNADDYIRSIDHRECIRRLTLLNRIPPNYNTLSLNDLQELIISLIRDPQIHIEYDIAERARNETALHNERNFIDNLNKRIRVIHNGGKKYYSKNDVNRDDATTKYIDVLIYRRFNPKSPLVKDTSMFRGRFNLSDDDSSRAIERAEQWIQKIENHTLEYTPDTIDTITKPAELITTVYAPVVEMPVFGTKYVTEIDLTTGKPLQLDRNRFARDFKAYYKPLVFKKTVYIFDKQTGLYSDGEGIINKSIGGCIERLDFQGAISRTFSDINKLFESNVVKTYPFNKYPNLIPVKNGILKLDYNIGSIELIPYTPDLLFTYKLNIDYDPTIRTDVIKALFKRWVKESDVMTLIQIPSQAILQMQRQSQMKKAYMNQGEPDSGKSTFLDLLMLIFGSDNVALNSLHKICEESDFLGGNLEGEMLNMGDDIKSIELESVENFKTLTGIPHVSVNKKFKPEYTGIQTVVQVYTCNSPPKFPKELLTDSAFWRRWEYTIFPNKFVRDVTFEEKEFTSELLSSYLNAIIEYILIVGRSGTLLVDTPLEDIQYIWSINADPLAAFVADESLFVYDVKTTTDYNKDLLKTLFIKWGIENGYENDERFKNYQTRDLNFFTTSIAMYHFLTHRGKITVVNERDNTKRRENTTMYRSQYAYKTVPDRWVTDATKKTGKDIYDPRISGQTTAPQSKQIDAAQNTI